MLKAKKNGFTLSRGKPERSPFSGAYTRLRTHMFSIPAAEDVLPNRRNQGLKPSEDSFDDA
jgi:hypothetical protein